MYLYNVYFIITIGKTLKKFFLLNLFAWMICNTNSYSHFISSKCSTRMVRWKLVRVSHKLGRDAQNKIRQK